MTRDEFQAQWLAGRPDLPRDRFIAPCRCDYVTESDEGAGEGAHWACWWTDEPGWQEAAALAGWSAQ
jgi:hypothetical protein